MHQIVRRGLQPASPAAFIFAVACVAAATVLRLAIELFATDVTAFAFYYPAVLIATLVGGSAAGILATLLSGLVAWWAFLPPRFTWAPLAIEQTVSICLFVAAAALIIWIASRYRSVVRQLEEEERYRKVMVDELGHRVKNKLATIYAILRHELRGRDDIWQSVSGRLRALSAADDFLARTDGQGVALRQILDMELQPYDASRVSLHGEPVTFFGKLPTVLALVFHELATNAAKYGALSAQGGRLEISWWTSGERIALDWLESGGPPVSEPSRRGFGSNLIERSLDSFGASAKIEFAPKGVICRMLLPKQAAPDTPKAAAQQT
jgi:two-component sensor histidine kinase